MGIRIKIAFGLAAASLCTATPCWAEDAGPDAVPPLAYGDIGALTELALAESKELGGLRRPGPPPTPAPEPEAQPPRLEIDAAVFLVSDYRARGLTVSDGKPAVQAELAIEHASGIFGSLWGSNVADNGGADLELDAAVGFGRAFGKVRAFAAVVGYVYPGAGDANYVEVQSGLTFNIASGKLGITAAYVPRQKNTGDQDNIYLELGAEYPLPGMPVSLFARGGYEDGFFALRKFDWELGATANVLGFDLGASYIDSTRSFGNGDGGGGLVGSIARTF